PQVVHLQNGPAKGVVDRVGEGAAVAQKGARAAAQQGGHCDREKREETPAGPVKVHGTLLEHGGYAHASGLSRQACLKRGFAAARLCGATAEEGGEALRSPDPSAASPAAHQNRASLLVPFSAIQKLTPSLQAPKGLVLAPVAKDPSVVRSAAFQSETL